MTKRLPRAMRQPAFAAAAVVVLMVAVGGVASACGGGSRSGTVGEYPIELTAELIARGKPIYEAGCSYCHGDATTPPPAPAAPPHSVDGHTWHHPDRLLVEWVLDGVPNASTMPKYRDVLTEDEVRAVIAYIKTFWTSEALMSQTLTSKKYENQRR